MAAGMKAINLEEKSSAAPIADRKVVKREV